MAEQPLPGARLLHGVVTSWKYTQRVRCRRLPPVVAWLRIWPEAPASRARATAGNRDLTTGWLARSLLRTLAPIRRPDPDGPTYGSMRSRGSRLTSTRTSGLATPSLRWSTRFVPP